MIQLTYSDEGTNVSDDVERCEGCGLRMVDDPGFPGALICPGCDADLLEGDA